VTVRLPRALVRAAMWLDYVVLMPAAAAISWRLALWWGRRRGDLLFWSRRVGREAAIANVAHGLGVGPQEARRIAHASFRARTTEEVETFFFPALTRDGYRRFIQVEGQEHLDAAQAQGKGTIVFSYHYGSMCLAMIALAHLGYKVNVLARSIAEDENPLAAIVRRYAEGKVARLEQVMDRPFIVTSAQGAMMKARRALKSGELLYILLSVPPELARRRANVRFLGHPAELPLGAEFLAEASGAPLVPFLVRRRPEGFGHVLEIGAEVPGPASGPGTLQRCIDDLDRRMAADPGQFFMWEFARSFWLDESHDTSYESCPPEGGVGADEASRA
jgi:KDO2-lipid IV(A) lauroyltransferase